MRWNTVRAAVIAAISLVFSSAAWAQSYPSKPVKMIVPFAPGGASDIVGRLIADRMKVIFNQPVIVDNRVGAAGTVGLGGLARATPDGSEILIGAGTYTVTFLMQKMPFDLINDVSSVGYFCDIPFVLTVNPAVPAKSVSELIAYAKANPKALNASSSGIGNGGHLALELFNSMAGTTITHVPYQGTGQSINDLLSNTVQLSFDSLLVPLRYAREGRLRLLAVTSPYKVPVVQELGTVADVLPGFEAVSWYGFWVPKGTPKPVIDTLYGAIEKITNTPDFTEKLAGFGMIPRLGTADKMHDRLVADTEKWGRLLKQAGVPLAK
jgi:tripartite-type tricarboxylate transporter receptor subunit TctC